MNPRNLLPNSGLPAIRQCENVEAAAQGMEKVWRMGGKDVLEANRKLVEQLDVKMKDFVSYQKMT